MFDDVADPNSVSFARPWNSDEPEPLRVFVEFTNATVDRHIDKTLPWLKDYREKKLALNSEIPSFISHQKRLELPLAASLMPGHFSMDARKGKMT